MIVGVLTSLRCVDLPVMPPVQPMLAKAVSGVPDPAKYDPIGLLFEPKWDGFRCIVFRDGDEVILGSRNDKPLTRYFPEIVTAACCASSRISWPICKRSGRLRRANISRASNAVPAGLNSAEAP